MPYYLLLQQALPVLQQEPLLQQDALLVVLWLIKPKELTAKTIAVTATITFFMIYYLFSVKRYFQYQCTPILDVEDAVIISKTLTFGVCVYCV